MSHICVSLGNAGCLLKIPSRCLEIIGWSESFENPLMHTVLDRALLASHSPLCKQPLVYITCKNDSTFSTDLMGSSFLDNACCFHFFKDCFIFQLCGMSPQLCDNFCNLLWNFSVSDCFPDKGTASSFICGNSGCIACLFDGKINSLMLLDS